MRNLLRVNRVRVKHHRRLNSVGPSTTFPDGSDRIPAHREHLGELPVGNTRAGEKDQKRLIV